MTITLTPIDGTGLETTLTQREAGLLWKNVALEAKVRELERQLAVKRWTEGAVETDIARLVAALTAAGVKVPRLKSHRVPLQMTLRKSPPRKAVLARDGIQCRYCGRKTTKDSRHIDHVVPVAQGGETSLENMAVCCRACNYRKGQKTLEEARMTLRPVPEVPVLK